MTGNAISRISHDHPECDIGNNSTNVTDPCEYTQCQELQVNIAVTLSLLVGVLMVSGGGGDRGSGGRREGKKGGGRKLGREWREGGRERGEEMIEDLEGGGKGKEGGGREEGEGEEEEEGGGRGGKFTGTIIYARLQSL